MDGEAGHTNCIGQMLLGDIPMLESKFLEVISK
jgi:hypothetical protein